MPTVIPSGVLSMPGRVAPNDRIIYAHIGVGGQLLYKQLLGRRATYEDELGSVS